MNDCSIISALTEIINSNPPVNIIDDILQTLEKEIDKHDHPDLDINAIASRLHQIYISPNPDVRAAVLYICRKLEEYSTKKITEKCMFDVLVSQSLGQKIPIDIENSTDYQLSISNGLQSSDQISLNRQNSQVTSLQNFRKIHHIFNCYNDFTMQNNSSGIIDKEKLACFKYIEMLIFQEGGCLPSSIIRALVSLYGSKYQFHKECKAAVLDILIQASLNFTEDQKYLMPSVLSVFSSYLLQDSTNMTIPAFYAYSIENNLPIIYDDLILMDFFLPLSNYSLFLDNKSSLESSFDQGQSLKKIETQIDEYCLNDKIDNAQQALIYFLRTWPGLLYFGIKNKAIEYLMICMPYKPKVVIQILKSLLSLKENTSSVTDGYSGFLLAELLKLGFIEKLNQECSTITQNKGFRANDNSKIVKTRSNSPRSSFSLFSNKLTSIQYNSNLNDESNEIIEDCENFINELLPFTSHCSTGVSQPTKPRKPILEKKTVNNIFQRSSSLNSDSDLEFNNMSSFLNLTGDEYSSPISSTPMNDSSSSTFKLNSDQTFSRMIDVAQVIMYKSNVVSVTDVLGKKKEFNYKTIKWTEIQILLTVVLPYDQSEAKASSKLYTSMINFLSTQEFNTASTAKRIEMFEPYSSLFDLLLNGKLEENYIEDNAKFKELIKSTIKEITRSKNVINLVGRSKASTVGAYVNSNSKKSPSKSSPIAPNVFSSTNSISPQINDKGCFDMNSAKWFIFRLLMKIMSNKKGIEILHKWKLGRKIIKMGKKIYSPQIADAILGEILFYPDSSLSIPMFLNFLSSYDMDIHKSALSQLRILRRKLPNFNEICFKPILIQHIKEVSPKSSSLFSSLNLLGEIISTDEASLITVCEDIDLIRIIFNNSHPIFSLLLSRRETKKTWDTFKTNDVSPGGSGTISTNKKPKSKEKNIPLNKNMDSSRESNSSSSIKVAKSDRKGRRISKEDLRASFSSIKFDEIVDREIRYWMDLGNLTYYLSFNSAVDAMFSDTLEEAIKKQPAIFLINGCAQPPPHLFGQLSKLEEGLKKLTPSIQELVNILVSLIDNPNFCFHSKTSTDETNQAEQENITNDESERPSSINYRATFQLDSSPTKDSSPPNSTSSSPPSPYKNIRKIPTPKTVPRIRQGSHKKSRHTADENVCGIFFALAQLGSVPSSSQIVEEFGIVEKMIQAAVASPSYVIKGALISALSLFAPSDYLSSVLQRYKWQKFRFGNRSCIIPRKPRSLFRETAVKKQNVITAASEESTPNSSYYQVQTTPKIHLPKIPIPRSSKEMSLQSTKPNLKTSIITRIPSSSFDHSLVANFDLYDGSISEDAANTLLSFVFDQKCLKKLVSIDSSVEDQNSEIVAAANELTTKIGKDKINRDLKIWANKLMASFEIANDARDLLNYLFRNIPLIDLPEDCQNKIEDKIEITSKFNQIYISSKGLYNDKKFKHIKPFIASIDEIKKTKPPFPEASLTEEEFKEVASISRNDFYNLENDKKEQIRDLLRGV